MKKLLIGALITLAVIGCTSCCNNEQDEPGFHKMTQWHNAVQLDYPDGTNFYYQAKNIHTDWNVCDKNGPGFPPGSNLKLEDGELCLWDHSATSVGYYDSKEDFKAIEAHAGSRVKYTSYGGNGNCIIVFKANEVTEIDTWD